MSDQWIVIPNWDRFQHYGKRDPVWIKVYVSLIHNPDYLSLSAHQRSVLHGLWLTYASSHCQLRANTASLSAQLALRVSSRQLEALSDAGFIELSASRPLAKRYQPASPEEEEEEEKSKNPLTPTEWGTSSNDKPTNSRAAGTNPRAVAANDKEQAHRELITQAAHMAKTWNGKDSAQFDEALDALEAELQSRLSFGERDDLWEKAFHHGF